MDCLVNLIGFRYCGVQEPSSGLYLNDLPGISIKSIDKIANDEQVTFFEVWNQVRKRSANLLHTAVVNALNKRYQVSRLSELFETGSKINQTDNETPASDEWRGVIVSLHKKSLLQFIALHRAKLFLKSASTFTVKVFQVHADNSLTEIHSKTIEGVQGWNPIKISGNYYGVSKILIAYDATAIESVYAPVDEDSSCDCCDACWDICDCSATIRGAKADKNTGELNYANNTFGLVVSVGIQCDFSTLICSSKLLFALPLQYLIARELMTERIHSDRLNRYTTIDANKARELRDEFHSQYTQELTAVLDGINLNTADCCIACNGLVTLQANLP